MDGYNQFCYTPVLLSSSRPSPRVNSTFTVWSSGDFEPCFESLVVTTGSSALFGITSALYAGSLHTKLRRKRRPPVLLIRALLGLCVVLAFTVQLVGSFWLSPWRPYSTLLSEAVTVLSWTVHLVCVWTMTFSIRQSGRGPLTLHCAWFLTLLASVFKLHTVISWNVDDSKYKQFSSTVGDAYFSLTSQVTTYVYFAIQVLYLLTLPFSVPMVTGDNVVVSGRKPYLTTQFEDSEEQSVSQHLLSSEWAGPTHTGYGSIETGTSGSHDLKIASEDGANLVSLLTFWWVGPLMKRGSLGLLRTPEDLPPLPSSLDTQAVRDVFRHATLESQRKGADGGSRWRLVRELNASFGLHYYPLGALKLLADLLGFAGPLLLHQLVAFMENGTVSVWRYHSVS